VPEQHPPQEFGQRVVAILVEDVVEHVEVQNEDGRLPSEILTADGLRPRRKWGARAHGDDDGAERRRAYMVLPDSASPCWRFFLSSSSLALAVASPLA